MFMFTVIREFISLCLLLNLCSNRVTRDGAKELAKVLKTNTGIKVLDIGFNRLEDDGAMHFAEAIATYNTTLEK